MKLLNSILKNRWLSRALAAVLVQQTLVAMGTFLMAQLASRASTQGLDGRLVLALLACVAFPGSLIHYLVVRLTTRAAKSVLLGYFEAYILANASQPTRWRDEEARKSRHDIMCRSGQDAILSNVNFIVDGVATALNIALNTASVILVTDRRLGWAIAAAGAIGLAIIHSADRKISASAQNEMSADSELNAHLHRSWDNLVLGNSTFYSRWKGRFDSLFTASQDAALRVVSAREKTVSMAGFVTTSIVVLTGFGLAWSQQDDRALVISILVMLPRSLQIVMHIQVVQSYWAQWKTLREKLAVTEATLNELEARELSPFIRTEKITVKGESGSFQSAELESILVKTPAIGRYTLLGANGAGKSTLLLELKRSLGSKAVYLPTHHQLELGRGTTSLSSGQIALQALSDAASGEAEVLLLDEWDSNLSDENRASQDQVISEISRSRLVIEVRHLRA